MSNGMRSCAQGVCEMEQVASRWACVVLQDLTPTPLPLGDPSKPATNQRFYNLLRHDYLNVSGTILSFQHGGNMAWSQGKVVGDEDQVKGCQMVCDDDKFDKYVLDAANEIGAPAYCIIAYPGTRPYDAGARNCQTWVSDVLNKAKENYLKNEQCPKCFR